MKIEEFKKLLKTKIRVRLNGTSQKYLDIKVKKYIAINRFEVYLETATCSKCGSSVRSSVIVDFFKPIENLTIFEAQLLYSLFVLNKIPYDYAQFHKSQAGKEFIENIKNVVVE